MAHGNCKDTNKTLHTKIKETNRFLVSVGREGQLGFQAEVDKRKIHWPSKVGDGPQQRP